MSSTRQPERRLMPAEIVYRSLRGGDRAPASLSGAALAGVRTAAALGSGGITFEQAADRLDEAGLPVRWPRTASTATAAGLEQITAARLVLEPAAAALATAAASPEDRDLLRERASFLATAAGGESDPHRLFRHDAEVHALLYRIAGGGPADPDLPDLCALAHRDWVGRTRAAGDVLDAVRPHLAELGDVLRAVAEGTPEEARHVATAHVWGTHLMLMQAAAGSAR